MWKWHCKWLKWKIKIDPEVLRKFITPMLPSQASFLKIHQKELLFHPNTFLQEWIRYCFIITFDLVHICKFKEMFTNKNTCKLTTSLYLKYCQNVLFSQTFHTKIDLFTIQKPSSTFLISIIFTFFFKISSTHSWNNWQTKNSLSNMSFKYHSSFNISFQPETKCLCAKPI